jgi:hypothetical protein
MYNWAMILGVFILSGCNDKKTNNAKPETINHEYISRLLSKDSANVIRAGKLLKNSDKLYLYVYNTRTGRHRLFYYVPGENNFEQTFEIDAGIGSSEARFIDGNFDNVTDIEIQFESGGNYDGEIRTLFLNKGESFQRIETQLSYPVYDFNNKVILSRYQGPNDSVITVERFQWIGDSLAMKIATKIPEVEYFLNYGSLDRY